MQQTQLPASQSNSPFQSYFRKSNTLFAPVTTSLQLQLPLLHRRPLPCRSSYQSCTGDHLPAPADTSSYQFASNGLPALAITFLHQQISAATSSAPASTGPEPATTFLHQQIPVTTSFALATTSLGPATTFLHQQIPVLNQ